MYKKRKSVTSERIWIQRSGTPLCRTSFVILYRTSPFSCDFTVSSLDSKLWSKQDGGSSYPYRVGVSGPRSRLSTGAQETERTKSPHTWKRSVNLRDLDKIVGICYPSMYWCRDLTTLLCYSHFRIQSTFLKVINLSNGMPVIITTFDDVHKSSQEKKTCRPSCDGCEAT